MKSSNFLIEHQCPQCGAPATLEETDHLFTCEFCRVKSFLLSRDFFRYMLPQRAPEGKELFYVPYWRFKGMFFSSHPEGIRQRIVDVSHQGVPSGSLPVSLGLRSQTMKLRFVSPETPGLFLKPTLPFKEVLQIIEERFSAHIPKPVYGRSFIGDTLSIIYSPFYLDGDVCDGILNNPVCPGGEGFDPETCQGGLPDWKIQFIPALCPDCGWDLDGERDSLVLTCRNCVSAWLSDGRRFVKLNFGYMPEEGENLSFLPFYRINAEISGVTLDSYADLVRLANLPKVIQEGWEERQFRFWSPAFKVRPEDLLRFGRNLTLSQPQVKFKDGLPRGLLHPVTLRVNEAVEGLKMTLASFMKPPDTMLPRLPEIEIRAKSFVLAYIPFHLRGNELSQPAFQLRINRNLLSYARHL